MSLHPQPFTVVPPETARVARRIPPGQPEVGGATEHYAELGIMLHCSPTPDFTPARVRSLSLEQ
jgi:hypothetical protein